MGVKLINFHFFPPNYMNSFLTLEIEYHSTYNISAIGKKIEHPLSLPPLHTSLTNLEFRAAIF